jgi:hypothetical protein
VAAKRKSFTISIQVEGMGETLRAFRDLPKEASDELRVESGEIAEYLAGKIRTAAGSDMSPQARIVAATLKVKRDRVPVLEVGGTKRIGRNKVPANRLMFGAEFGSNRFRQFHKRHTGTAGSWFYGTVKREEAEIGRMWLEAADRIIAKWAEGGQS